MPHPTHGVRQRGGMLSLLLTLIAIGAIAYFALKSGGGGGRSDSADALGCEPRIAALVRDTGGVGAAAQAAYDQLPAECRKLLPSPASLAPSPERAPES